MRAYEKKKLFKKFCREQVKNGYMNYSDGTWKKPPTSGSEAGQYAMMRNGYKLR